MQRYHVEVISGKQRGLLCKIDSEDPLIIGSAPTSGLQLTDASVKPLHARLVFENYMLWLVNLSSSGTLLNQRLVTQKSVLTNGDILNVGDVTLQIKTDEDEDASSNNTANIVMPIIILIIIIVGTILCIKAYNATNSSFLGLQQEATHKEWWTFRNVLDDRVNIWIERKVLPESFGEQWTRAWFYDCSGNVANAIKCYQKLFQWLSSNPLPGITPENKTVAQTCRELIDKNAINRILHIDVNREIAQRASLTNPDEAYLETLWFFIGSRLMLLREK